MSDNFLKTAQGRPTVVSVVICDSVLEDKRTNNKSLIGLFNAIQAVKLPALHAQMFIVVSLMDGEGRHEMAVHIRKPSGGPTIQASGPLEFPDPRAVIDIVLDLNGVPLEEYGTHFVDVLVDGSPAAYRRFEVVDPNGGKS